MTEKSRDGPIRDYFGHAEITARRHKFCDGQGQTGTESDGQGRTETERDKQG